MKVGSLVEYTGTLDGMLWDYDSDEGDVQKQDRGLVLEVHDHGLVWVGDGRIRRYRVHVHWFRGFKEWAYSTRLKELS